MICESIKDLKAVIRIIFILSGRDRNYIEKEIQKKCFIIYLKRILYLYMIPHVDKDMKYGIIHKDFKRAEEYVVRKAKKISEEYM